MAGDRLNRLDAWRAFCCIGVLWIHCWHINNSIPITVLGFNIAKPLSIIGNGVDFFYVISGFCMYYFYLNKLKENTFESYKNFILSRWYRIVPAYYFAVVVYIIIARFNYSDVNVLKLLATNFLFVQNFSKDFEVSAHFWSIAVEWQFYLFFPIILYSYFSKNKFVLYFSALTLIVSVLGVFLLTINYNNDLHLPVRFVEFSAGIFMAYYFKLKVYNEKNLYLKILLGLCMLFLGRLFNTDGVLNYWNTNYTYSILKVLGYALMSAGFAVLLFYTIGSKGRWFSFLEWTPIVFIGRISYSFYLWHAVVFYTIWEFSQDYFHMGALYSLLLQFVLSLVITIPIAYLSYRYIELRFKFQWKNKE